MELFRVGEVLLRAQAQPLLPFLAPSACQRLIPTTRTATRPSHHGSSYRRSFATSLIQQQDAQMRAPSTAHDDITRLLETSLDGNKGTPTAPTGRTSRFKSNTAQQTNPPSRLEQYRPSSGTSMGDILQGAMEPQRGNRSAIDVASYLNPMGHNTIASDPPKVEDKPLPMKLNASVGRSIAVDSNRGMDVGRAFRALEIQCARNSVRRDFQRQRFHERPGLKRKRLKSERWRRRFKEGFKGVVALVQKMKKQGW